MARSERMEVRDEAKRQREHETEEAKRQREHETEEAKRQREHETEEAKRQREHELQVLAARTTESNGNGNQNFGKSPKIPVFSDGTDMIDSYIQRFERFVQANNWRREEWAQALSTLLTGKALDVYSRLSDENFFFKDPRVASEKNHSVYKIDCVNCVSSYIGETSKKVEDRVKEHRRNIITGNEQS